MMRTHNTESINQSTRLVPGEAVNEKVVLLRGGHGPLQQGAGDLYRDYGAVSDVVLDQLTEL